VPDVNIARLLRMPLLVLLDRGRQEVVRRLERIAVERRLKGRHYLPPVPDSEVPGPPNKAALTELATRRCLAAATRRFFPGALSERSLLLEAAGDGGRGAIAEGEALCAGEFRLLGYPELSFGRPIDWHLDPVSGRRSPRVHWTRIDPLDPAVVGDSKVVWELNRHQWFVRLGQAYRFTGDERYARFFAESLGAWMRDNPPGIGINWASSLEAALRLIAWSWAAVLFRDSGSVHPGLRSDILTGVASHAAHVSRYLSHSFSPNTHLTGEALGLYYAGTVFAELEGAMRWRRRGREILLRELRSQVLDDGVYFEQSTCYQRYTAEIYLHFLALARRNAEALPADAVHRVQALVDWLMAVQYPDGSLPRIGDEDGGSLISLQRRAVTDSRGVFSLAGAMFRRPDYVWAARGETAEAVWMLGRAGLDALRGTAPRPPRHSPSRHFPRGGYAVMRSDWSAVSHQILLDAGPLGCPHSSGHGHADLLSVQCAVFGRPLLVDPGTYCYTPAPAWRNYFRSTSAHNTVAVDGAGQAEPAGPFRWKGRPAATLHAWYSSPTSDFADAWHDAYTRLPGRVRHRRRVLFVKPACWIVVDDLAGEGVHECQLRFQFAAGVDTVERSGWTLAAASDEAGMWLGTFAEVSLDREMVSGAVDPIAGWVSPVYGQRIAAPQLIRRATGTLPLRLVSVMLPCVPALSAPPSLQVGFAPDRSCRVRMPGANIRVDDNTMAVEYLSRRDPRSAGARRSREDEACVE